MAAPNFENGFTRIPHELIEAFAKTKITGECMRVLMVIIRYSYGYSHDSTQLSLGRISELTSLDRRNVNRMIFIMRKIKKYF